jgi:hypothetical protein
MNGLNNAGIFPYSLNNLQVLSLPDGASLPVSCDVPLIRTLTSTNQEISLFESDPDLIDFDIYDKSLKVNTIFAGSGSFNNIYSTGANFLTLNATGINCNTITATTSILSNGSMNAPNANITCFGINSVGGLIQTTNGFTGPFITASSGTFQNVNTNTLTANTININTVNIPNLSFNIATGGFLSTTGTISTQQNFRTTNGINTFDFTDISSSGDTSIYNAGGALQTSFRFDGNERMKLSSSGNLDVSFLQSSGTISTTSGRIQNLNSAWTTNLNDYFINANNDTIFLRPKGETATPADAQAFLTNAGNFTISTGTLSAFNGTFSGGLSATNANISAFALTASGFVRAPYFTGAKIDTNFLTFTTATGGTVRSNLVVRNPQTLQFNQLNDTQIVRIEPAGASNVLSYYDASNVLQETYTTSSSGANIDFINQMGVRDLTATGRVINGDGNQATPAYTFVNDTNTGFYRIGSDNIALTLGNRRNMNFTQNTITMGSGANNGVDLNLQGTLQLGGTSNAASSLINMGYSGSIFGVNNFRMGYIFHGGTTLEINNQNASTGSNTVGQIQLTPANSSNTFIKRANGQMINNARGSANDYTSFLVNFNTGAFGLVLQNPNSEGYLFSTQTFGNNSAHTMHGAVSNVMSNLTIGRTNFPFSAEEALTLRPWSNTGSRTTEIKIANTVNEAFGYTIMGMSPSGSNAGGKNVSNFGFISNSNALGGFYICTNTNTTVPNTYPRYFVDGSGNHEFSLSSITGAFSITSSPYSVGIGTSFSSTRGQGRFVPLSVASLTNTTYTGGTEFLVRGSSSSNNDHSAFTTNQFSADWKGVYDIRYNLNMNSATATDTVFIRIKVGGTTRQVSTHRIETVASNAQGSLFFNCTAGQLIELFIQGDTRNINMNNDSTFTICYVG